MENYSIETMEKLVNMVESGVFSGEEQKLLKEMVLDEFDRCMSCNPSVFLSDCPYRLEKSSGQKAEPFSVFDTNIEWETKCELTKETYHRDVFGYLEDEYPKTCPYLKLRRRIK